MKFRLLTCICLLFPVLVVAKEVSSSAVTLTEPIPAITELVPAALEHELHNNILRYWREHAFNADKKHFYGQVDIDGKQHQEVERGALLSSRILWTFSAAHQRYPQAGYRVMAERAFADLERDFWDLEYGGLYWSVMADGTPLATHKQIYGQVFGIYGYSEYYRATGNPLALQRAQALYRLLEAHALDTTHGGYVEAVARDWSPLTTLSTTLGAPTVKSQNTHLHVMEAYTNLLRIWPDAGLRAQQIKLVNIMLNTIMDNESYHLGLFFDADWTLHSPTISYGHDIEAAWLLVEAAEVLADPALLARTRQVAVRIAEVTLVEGVDSDGGVFNEGGAEGVTDTNKDWWPQAEALVGFLNAYDISRDPRFYNAAINSWRFIQTHIVDTQGGEWHWGVNQAGQAILRPKISLWKCPYHNSRALMETIARLQKLPPV